MIYKNKFMLTKSKKLKISFDKFFQALVLDKDENLLDINDGVIKYNLFASDGSLKNCYGIRDLTITKNGTDRVIKSSDTEVLGIWYARWLHNANSSAEDYLFYMTGNQVSYLDLKFPQYTFNLENTFQSVPTVTKIRQNLTNEAFAFTSSDGIVVLDQSTETAVSTAPKILDACYHYNKLFAITDQTRNALVYSSETDITDWTNQNTYRIDFTDDRGRLLKILSFNDNLYIFREFGITKVSLYSLTSDFSIDHLYESSSYIYPETISICDGKVIFMTKDGLYSFNGSSVKKLDFKIIDKVEKTSDSQPCGISFNGKYFLACRISFSEGEVGCESETDYVNNSVIIFDFEEKNYEIMRGVDIKKFASLSSLKLNRLCAIFRGSKKHRIGEFIEGGQIFGTVLNGAWMSPFTDLGFNNNLKHVTELKILAKANCQVKIESEEGVKTYQVTGSTKVQRLKVDVKGKTLKFSVVSNSSSQKISKPEISVTVYM